MTPTSGPPVEVDVTLPDASHTSTVLALTTGGTLDKIYTAQGQLEVGEPCLPAILREAHACVDLLAVEVLRKDSLDLDADDQRMIQQQVRQAPQRHVLVTHGTDTMVETALLLRDLCLDKTIVLTGAIQPHSMRCSDAAFNIGFALGALPLLPSGVYIAMNGQVFAADRVSKDRTLGRFVPLE